MDIKWFTKADCKGILTTDMTKGKIKYGTQYDTNDVASVHVSRDLMNDEQLDFSMVPPHRLRRSDNSTLEERNMLLDCSLFVVSAPVAPVALTAGTHTPLLLLDK